QSLRGAVARLSGSPDRAHLLWLGLALVVVVAGLALAARLSGPDPRAASASASASGSGSGAGRPLLGLGVAALTGLLVSPISWNHHWVWFLPLAIALAARAVETGRRFDRLIAGGWVATFCLASISWWPFAGQDDYRLGPLNTVAADCYVLAALFVAGLIAWAELGLMNFRCVHTGNSSGQSITRSPPGLP
ncbi:MAG: alpha,2-mannosyltransferase, partial [Acidimicrobiaceae bacterium]|nr:alpha,2-mannosyltransferase [Acidimicrobiaceae bacterium]